jgi:hypothetical protein
VGETREIDVTSVPGINPVLLKIACVDKNKVNGFTDLYVNGRGFRLEWEVKDELSFSSKPYDGQDKRKQNGDGKGSEDFSVLILILHRGGVKQKIRAWAIFGAVAWAIWLMRNDLVFNNKLCGS